MESYEHRQWGPFSILGVLLVIAAITYAGAVSPLRI